MNIKQDISGIFIKHNLPTRQIAINEIVGYIEKRQKEQRDNLVDKILLFREDTRNDGYGQYISTIDYIISLIKEDK
jgi:hypothetical protein